jgi:hypothetical protein
MNWKPTWVLLATAVVALAFIVLFEHPLREERLRQAGRAVLPGFNPATVTNIEIQPRSQPAIVVRRAAGNTNLPWRLTQPISYPAQGEQVEALLQALAKLEWQERIAQSALKDMPDAQEQFGFTRPQFSIVLQGTEATRRLEIGELSALGDQVYLSVVGNSTVCLAATDLLRVIPRDKNDWRDLSALDLAGKSFQSLRIRSAGKEFALERDPTNHFWFMTDPLPARADTSRINDLLRQLQNVEVRVFVTDDPQADLDLYGLRTSPQTPDLVLSFFQGTNVVTALQVGASPSNHLDLAYARRLDLGNVVAVDRGPFRAWQTVYTNFLDQHLMSVPPNWVESIDVRGDDSFSVQKQTNGQWVVRAVTSFTADATLMEDWLASLTNITTEIEKTVVADFSEYGLSSPALQYTFKFGPGVQGLAPTQIDFGAVRNGRVFERRADESPIVNTISQNDSDRLPRVSWQLRDRSIWTFASSNVVRVKVHQQGGTREYLRDPEGEWTFAPGYHAPPYIDSPSMEEAVHRIGGLRAVYWDGLGDDHLERFGFTNADYNLEFVVKRPEGTNTLRLEFGGRSPYSHPYASVMTGGQRLIFEFPVDLYENFVEPDLSLSAALRRH